MWQKKLPTLNESARFLTPVAEISSSFRNFHIWVMVKAVPTLDQKNGTFQPMGPMVGWLSKSCPIWKGFFGVITSEKWRPWTTPKMKPASLLWLNIAYHITSIIYTWIAESITSLKNNATRVNPTVYSPLKSSHQGLENTPRFLHSVLYPACPACGLTTTCPFVKRRVRCFLAWTFNSFDIDDSCI